MPYIVGIDQGGTKTDIIIADHAGNIAAAGNDRDWVPENAAPPAGLKGNLSSARRALRMTRIQHAFNKAMEAAGLKLQDIESVSACCTGADWAFEYEIDRRYLLAALSIEKISLYNDCVGALRGGIEIKNRDCAVLCIGTGANCAVMNRE